MCRGLKTKPSLQGIGYKYRILVTEIVRGVQMKSREVSMAGQVIRYEVRMDVVLLLHVYAGS